MTQSLTLDDLHFEIRRSEHRQTVGITVERDGSLFISAPPDCSLEQIEQVAKAKRFWVYTKLNEKDALLGPTKQERPRDFVSGEGFYYLGRSYRLLLIEATDPAVPSLRLHQGRFQLRRDALPDAQQHFVEWYIAHGQPWLQSRVDLYAQRVGVTPSAVVIRDLGYRWGSCSKSGQLNFHWRTVCLPSRIIEYVVLHELVHLGEPHHSPEFWERLTRAMPDFEERKRWLAEHGREF